MIRRVCLPQARLLLLLLSKHFQIRGAPDRFSIARERSAAEAMAACLVPKRSRWRHPTRRNRLRPPPTSTRRKRRLRRSEPQEEVECASADRDRKTGAAKLLRAWRRCKTGPSRVRFGCETGSVGSIVLCIVVDDIGQNATPV